MIVFLLCLWQAAVPRDIEHANGADRPTLRLVWPWHLSLSHTHFPFHLFLSAHFYPLHLLLISRSVRWDLPSISSTFIHSLCIQLILYSCLLKIVLEQHITKVSHADTKPLFNSMLYCLFKSCTLPNTYISLISLPQMCAHTHSERTEQMKE